jgi:hypothetical protein
MIVRRNPESGLDQADQAWFESDAPSNTDAIREIDQEASRHGLVRVREYWLQTVSLPDGRVARRGFCYRPEPTAAAVAERVTQRRLKDRPSHSSAEITREMRDRE